MSNKEEQKLKPQILDTKRVKIVDSSTGYDKKVLIKTMRLPNGMEEKFFIDEGNDSVQIFAITKDQQVVCVKQFRPGNEQINLEIPGGGLEKGEDAAKAAARELVEESGFAGNPPVFLAALPYSPYSTGVRHMFMVTECRKVAELDLDPNEFLEVVLVPLEEFRELMLKGAVRGHDTAYMGLDKLGRLKF
jgi:ADP-ribose pyrophosphatase